MLTFLKPKQISTHIIMMVSIALTISLLQGCGFKLRSDYQLSKQFSQMQVSSDERHSKLQKALANRLAFLDVNVVEKRSLFKEDIPTVYLRPEKLERKLLSLFPSGQVAEYELIYQVRYQFFTSKNQDPIEREFSLTREYQDDPDQVLAKSRELELILDELRQQAADRIIRSLSITN